MAEVDHVAAVPRLRWPTRETLAGYWSDLTAAWRVPAVKRGLFATFLLFLGSLTPAYLPQNSPWWEPIRALGWDTWPAKVIGTALVVSAVVLLVSAWFRLRPGLYLDFKHWAVCLIWSLPLLFAPPIFSHDAYSYAAQGWLLHNGLNPYETPVSVLPGAFADQVAWVALGSAGWTQAGQTKLPGGKAISGGMPAWAASLAPEDLMAVVLHERTTLDQETFDAATWEDGFEETLKKHVPDQADAYMAVLDEWKTNPPE